MEWNTKQIDKELKITESTWKELKKKKKIKQYHRFVYGHKQAYKGLTYK